MDILNIIGSAASIISLVIALFLAVKIVKIDKSISVVGKKNIVGGRDVEVKR